MNYKVSELEGALLDAAVAKANGDMDKPNFVFWPPPGRFPGEQRRPALEFECDPEAPARDHDLHAWKMWQTLDYSTDWSLGGPLMDRENIATQRSIYSDGSLREWIAAYPPDSGYMEDAKWWQGETRLIAAMRAYVASRFGETVELP